MHSSQMFILRKSYVYTIFGKKNERICCNKAFTSVALKPRKSGIKKPLVLSVRKKRPAIKPIIARKSALRPSGDALRISRKSPEKKPFVSPSSEPL